MPPQSIVVLAEAFCCACLCAVVVFLFHSRRAARGRPDYARCLVTNMVYQVVQKTDILRGGYRLWIFEREDNRIFCVWMEDKFPFPDKFRVRRQRHMLILDGQI